MSLQRVDNGYILTTVTMFNEAGPRGQYQMQSSKVFLTSQDALTAITEALST